MMYKEFLRQDTQITIEGYIPLMVEMIYNQSWVRDNIFVSRQCHRAYFVRPPRQATTW